MLVNFLTIIQYLIVCFGNKSTHSYYINEKYIDVILFKDDVNTRYILQYNYKHFRMNIYICINVCMKV